MKINILTIFPEIFDSFLNEAIVKKAIEAGHLEVNLINFRDYTENKHKKIDDYVFGGSEGMLLMPQPLFDAFEKNNLQKTHSILMTPQGNPLKQNRLQELSKMDEITITCGRYEGFDQRFINEHIDEEISIGDYVLLGGEVPAQVLIEGIVRLIPGVLNNPNSTIAESFSDNLLESDKYTRPADFRGMKVPDVLMSGHHAEIEKWERENSIQKTQDRRPDLLEK